MQVIRHRVNTVRELAALDPAWGVEFDIRSRQGKLILNHEPHAPGDSFDVYAREFAKRKFRGPMIVNPKEDGHETAILDCLRKHGIRNFFFLDLTLPTVVRLAVRHRLSNIAVRVSEYEPPESALPFKGRVKWVWLDCFSGRPPRREVIRRLKPHFKICLVSPELEGYAAERIRAFRFLRSSIDAVCTKHPESWIE